jgi:hypothetical protein
MTQNHIFRRLRDGFTTDVDWGSSDINLAVDKHY